MRKSDAQRPKRKKNQSKLDHRRGTWHLGGFQTFGGVPGEDFDMQNSNLRSTIEKSDS